MSHTEQLYQEMKNLRNIESWMGSKKNMVILSHQNDLIDRKVKAMAKIGELNRDIYGKR